MKKVLLILVLLSFADTAYADSYYRTEGGTVYYYYTQPYTYSYCGRSYTYNKWYKKPYTDTNSPSFDDKILDLIDKQKEREKRLQMLSYLGAQNLMAPAYMQAGYAAQQAPGYVAQQQLAIPYPSATGSTVGGYSSVDIQRYGYPTGSDLSANRAYERAMQSLDQYERSTAQSAQVAQGAHGSVSTLLRLSSQDTRVIAESQELRATVSEMARAQQAMWNGLSQAMLAAKAQPSESVHIERGDTATTQPSQPPPGVGPEPEFAPRPLTPDFVVTQCGECHGPGLAKPKKGFRFGPGIPITEAQFGALVARMQPDAKDYRGDPKLGIPYRMPPVDAEAQPTPEQRREAINFARSLIKESSL